ncbi:hypothetical protein C9374_004419 [Naegleria lovaniensis]|uniref:Uncharacterized protein n=1 Tax=Naegleria lovaniensis TaxID=51637 RepID=A0AA88GRA7_NAELO|nr:uncharacterized protein C9374_004419 [Naegleria lovaniensis]KAG2383082.1 hypothetical protein C9374_004419 [Naegleria lovaniensis]
MLNACTETYFRRGGLNSFQKHMWWLRPRDGAVVLPMMISSPFNNKQLYSSPSTIMMKSLQKESTSRKLFHQSLKYLSFSPYTKENDRGDASAFLEAEFSSLYPKIKTTQTFSVLYSGQVFSDLALSDPIYYKIKLILNHSLFLGVDKPSRRFLYERLKQDGPEIALKVPLPSIMELVGLTEQELLIIENKLEIYQQPTTNNSPTHASLENLLDHCSALCKKIFHLLKTKEERKADIYFRRLHVKLKELGVETLEAQQEHPTVCFLYNKRHLIDAEKEFLKCNDELMKIQDSMSPTEFQNDKEVNRKKASDASKVELYAKYLIGDLQFRKAIYFLGLASDVAELSVEKHSKHFSAAELDMLRVDRERRYYQLAQLYTFVATLAREYSGLTKFFGNDGVASYTLEDSKVLHTFLLHAFSIQVKKDRQLKSAFRQTADLYSFMAGKKLRDLKQKCPSMEQKYPLIKLFRQQYLRSMLPSRIKKLLIALGICLLLYAMKKLWDERQKRKKDELEFNIQKQEYFSKAISNRYKIDDDDT